MSDTGRWISPLVEAGGPLMPTGRISMKPEIEYLPDESVDSRQDQELRNLFSTCFTAPHDAVFKERRYFCEPYPHRWVIRNEQGVIVAHIGVHEKTVKAGGEVSKIAGIAEVSIHPDYRGRGYVRMMLSSIHDWLAAHGFVFAVLFGKREVYQSSGYVVVENLYHGDPAQGERKLAASVMVKELSGKLWPETPVFLPGPAF
jgi:predicted acetyltransferase